MTSSFEDENGVYVVLVNRAGQYSLWPESAIEADGWSVVHGPARRDACLDYINEHWTALRLSGA
jgi:MbtH protein